MRVVEVQDTFTITGRGDVASTTMPDPPYEVNEVVEVDGKPMRVVAIERHPLLNDAGLRPGMRVGLLVTPA